MGKLRKPVTLLLADDDPESRLLLKEAFAESDFTTDLRFVRDGEELMEYLRQRGRYADPRSAPRPAVILLDLNMPRKDGREALKEIKADPALRQLPVVVLTTSKAEEDVTQSYELGVNSFITKPATFAELVDVIKAVGKYWFEVVELPPQ